VVSQSSKSKRVATNRRSGKKTSTASKKYTAGTSIVAAAPSTVVARAQSWRGVRYRYGSASRSGTDCSGFTSQLYRTVGVSLPRTSRAQAQVGQRVGKGSLKSGDLVFFRTSRGNRISHVGIYQGNGKFIHASNPRGGVMVSSLSDGYYSKRFVTARRVASGGTSASRKKSSSSVKSVASKAKAAPREEPFPDKVPPLEPAAKN
jgi:cell wall-associated NlpC family hydrolase